MKIKSVFLLMLSLFGSFQYVHAQTIGNIEVTNYFASAENSNSRNLELLMKIDNGGDSDQLLSANSPDCLQVKLVRKSISEGSVEIELVDKIDVPMDKQIELSNANTYLSCEALNESLEEGKTIHLFLTFAMAGKTDLYLPIKKHIDESSGERSLEHQKRGRKSRFSNAEI